MQLSDYLKKLGLKPNLHIMVHSSFRAIRNAFPQLSIEHVINKMQKSLSVNGSLIMPAFTYCFKKSQGNFEIFNQDQSLSKVGAVSEVFRKSNTVIRTASPTHSFSLWGRAANEIGSDNNPKSPLGKGSVMDWFASQPDAYTLLLGVNFSAMSFCHYLEVAASVPWYDYSPWEYLNVENIGVSTNGETELYEIPGCSKSFINFENYLKSKHLIQAVNYKTLTSYLIPIPLLLEHGLIYFRNYPEKLLCEQGSCEACDSRWLFYLKRLKNLSQV